MKRVQPSAQLLHLLKSARRLAQDIEARAIVMLAELPYDFTEIRKLLKKVELVVTADKPDVQRAVTEDEVTLVPLLNEPQTRQLQVSQALLEAIADEILQPGDKIVAVYASYDRDMADTLSVINLSEHLAKLTSRDLQRLETRVPLETLRIVVDVAVEIGREGREGKPVGTLFVVGDHRKVLPLSHEAVHDPFKGYNQKERMIRSARTRESVKELAQVDGAFVISSDGIVISGGRILDAAAEGLSLSKGLGARHWAAAAITKVTNAVAITVSESTGTVRLFQNGTVSLRIEPMDRAMKWADVETEAPT